MTICSITDTQIHYDEEILRNDNNEEKQTVFNALTQQIIFYRFEWKKFLLS